ncbi:MAG: hypothetical protein NTZ57_08350, partial [Deltaproteobacteria bacterium]|nr:hypothetical protein [Deltaproteobacteria bacterium]
TPSIKNIIRENKLNQLNSVIQMSKNEGMYTADQYLGVYLEGRKNFMPYSRIFRASVEDSTDILYKSPLTADKREVAPLDTRKRKARTETEPIIIRSDYSGPEVEHMLTIDEDESLQDLLKKMDK